MLDAMLGAILWAIKNKIKYTVKDAIKEAIRDKILKLPKITNYILLNSWAIVLGRSCFLCKWCNAKNDRQYRRDQIKP